MSHIATQDLQTKRLFTKLSFLSKHLSSNITTMTSTIKAIPQPPTAPFIGNLTDIDVHYPLGSMVHLAKKYGPIYKLSLAGQDIVVVSSWRFVHEVCDDDRFKKSIQGDLEVYSATATFLSV